MQYCQETIYRSRAAGQLESVELCSRPIRPCDYNIRFWGQIHSDDIFEPSNTGTIRMPRPDRPLMRLSQISRDDAPSFLM